MIKNLLRRVLLGNSVHGLCVEWPVKAVARRSLCGFEGNTLLWRFPRHNAAVRRSGARNVQLKGRSFSQARLHRDRSAQERAITLRQCKTEPCAAEFFRRVQLCLTEIVEDALQAFFAHSDA